MASQNETRFVRRGVVGDHKRDVLGRMSGSMQYLDRDVSQFEYVAVADFVEWEVYIRASEQHVLRACGLSQLAASGNVIGVQVRVDHVANAHSDFFGRAQVRRYVAEGVNNGSYRLASTTEHVGCCDRVGVQELAQNHGFLPRRRSPIFNYSIE